MTDYKMLAVYYLKHNKKRSITTILGVVIAVLVLFVLLNIALDYFLDQRTAAREEADYDLVLYTESQSQIDEITSREDIKSAYVGEGYDYKKQALCKSALYVNLNNPYKMSKTLKELEQAYNIVGEVNPELALYYFNDGDDNMIFIAVMLVILFAYIFAIFGVGIIRNSIQLSLLEQIKDYGILRCIGATKGQLRTFIYIMGAILEIIGLVIGVVLGYPLSVVVGFFFHNSIGFHILPVIVILVVFLFDLYFVMQENCKFINRMTPISAVRGEFRIKKEKIKARGKGILGRLFGMEGEYAYKSLMRNPGRFWKSVFAIGIGVAAFIVMMSCTRITGNVLKDAEKHFGKYQLYFYNPITPDNDAEAVMANLPSMEILEKIAAEENVTVVKRMYLSNVYATTPDAVVGRLTDEYCNGTGMGSAGKRLYEKYRTEDSEKTLSIMTEIALTGYDEEDYKDLENQLIDGTLDISENGLVLIGASEEVNKPEDDTLIEAITYDHYTISDYKVGDTIDIVDPQKLMALVKERQEEAEKEEKEGKDPWAKYNGLSITAFSQKELIEAGDYKTYTIEGIVDIEEDGWTAGFGFLKMIVPLDNYFAITGMGEDQISGIKCHMEKNQISSSTLNLLEMASYDGNCSSSGFESILYICVMVRKTIAYAVLAVLFVVTLSGVNIVNTTASNLHLRRKEFAQLRVIGLPKKRLVYTVMLEGIATTVGANIVGILVGMGITYYLYIIFKMFYPVDFMVPWLAMLCGLIASSLLLCGAIYVPLKSLPMDMASDLTTDGD
ncbi:MAG: ABC transporter permease [Lachnospiraceae bacterium]|nr:ABC transporter permease [Lachnospiraceae bacterium]